jgi:hypothetical protein
MRKIILATFLIFIASSFVLAQTGTPVDAGTPAGAGDSNLSDNNIKLRSVELERIKREAEKTATVRREDGVELNFSIIKNDFEGIQKEQADIIAGYQSSSEIDYKKIHNSSGKMTEMAIRLKANLFQSAEDKKVSDKDSEEDKASDTNKKSIRNLIIDLDNAIGDLVTNTMFQNLSVIDPELSKKAQSDLDNIIKLSGELWLESNKMKSK